MTASTVPLNPEIFQPQERAEQDLSPKSHADAIMDSTGDKSGQGEANQAIHYGAESNLENSISHTGGSPNGSTPVNNDTAKPTSSESLGESKGHEWRSGGENLGNDRIVYEKYANDKGEHLTSGKVDDGYEKSLEHHRETAPRKKEKAKTSGIAKKNGGSSLLASGRRAGAGWERSA
jgi:hypothetical protein